MSYTGTLRIRAIALEPIHHGAKTQGNTVSTRRQEVMLPDGTIDTVPFVSGNSLRHMIRDAGVRYALEAMGIPEGSLSKPVVDLLFSGGSLGGKGKVTLASARRIAELFPILAVLGYSAGSRITGGRLEVSHMHVICEQNIQRRPDWIDMGPRWLIEAGPQVGTMFATRVDAARIEHSAAYLALTDKASDIAAADKPKGRAKEDKPADSTQMIFDWEVILPGAELWATVTYRGLKSGELDALVSALSYACDGRHSDGGYLFTVGAKRGTGHGRMSWHIDGLARPITTPVEMPADLLPVTSDGAGADRLAAYRARLAEARAEILRWLEELAA